MLIIGLVLNVFGIGFFCWLVFTLAVYALPFFIGLTAGLAALHGGAGIIAALAVAILAGGLTLAIGRIAFAASTAPLLRGSIGLIYAVPAALAGHQASFALAGLGAASTAWCEVVAVIGGALVGCTAFARLTLLGPPALWSGNAASPARTPMVAGTTIRQ